MNKKIACLTTGGTIISEQSEKGLKPSDKVDVFTEKVRSQIDESIDIDFFPVHNIDSSDLTTSNIENIALKVKEIASKINDLEANYDGFVITHGTDTMAYTSSALSYMIKGLKKPIILTGSMKPIQEDGTDRVNNLINSFNASVNGLINGVYISFGDKLIYGNKSVKMDSSDFHTFDSPNLSLVGEFLDNTMSLDKYLIEQISKKIISTSKEIDIDTKLESKIQLLKMFPTIDYSIFEYYRSIGTKGLVIEGYGDGNVPDNAEFITQIQKCLDTGMKIILKSQCVSGEVKSKYAGGKALVDMGCINTGPLTSEAALAKLMWGIAKGEGDKQKIDKLLRKSINGDLNLK